MKRPLTIDPARTAAFFIDMQEEHRLDQRYLVEGYETVLANAARIQEAARSAGIPLYHFAYIVEPEQRRRFHPTMADGTSAFSDVSDPNIVICPEVAPRAGENAIVKDEASAFGSTSPIALLRRDDTEWLIVCGVWTEACVDATVKAAVTHGFRVLLVKDACGTGTEAMHQTGILNLANRLYGGAVVTTDQVCRLIAGETLEAWQVQGSVPIRFSFDDAPARYAAL